MQQGADNKLVLGKCGKQARKVDARTVDIGHYFKKEMLPKPPATCDWAAKVTQPWGMMQNDVLRDCTSAAAAHQAVCWTANATGAVIDIPDDAVVDAYKAVAGYVPGDESTDNGAAELDMLNYWRKTGIGGHTIMAYATVEYSNHNVVKQCIYLFGGLYTGLLLPNSIFGQEIWDVPAGGPVDQGEPGTYGSHAVVALAYDDIHITVISWGKAVKLTWAFWDTYCDEAYACLSADFLKKNRSPEGVELQMLEKDLLNITGEKKPILQQLAEASGNKAYR
jgi:hypothetical protein